MEIGNAIKQLRKARGINQKRLAELCDISANALCSIEKGVSFPSKDTIERICSALGVPVSYLLFFSISEADVPSEKLAAFNALREPLATVLLSSLDSSK